MLPLKTMTKGGYRYIPFEFQYSSGVQAMPGYRIVRATLSKVVPIAQGFDLIKRHLESQGLPLQAFAACELRSPKPFDPEGFVAFNKIYAGTLGEWGIAEGADNPIARSNVCPLALGPSEPGFYGFSYTVADDSQKEPGSFIIAGGAETRAAERREDVIVEYKNLTEQGIFNKGMHTMGEMERRLAAFGLLWDDTTAVHVYTVHDFHKLLTEQMAQRGIVQHGLTWQLCRPPVVDVEFEMDCRGVHEEFVLTVQ